MTLESKQDNCMISTQNLSWSVGDRAILKKLTLHIPKASFAGLIGPNGAGKTTLLRCFNGFYPTQKGQVDFQGQLISSWNRKELAQQQALISQQQEQILPITVFELVRMGLIPYKSIFSGDTQADLSLIANTLELVGLLDKAQQSVETLSGGERQRAMIARALVQQPSLLLLDEPTNHLDVSYQHQILNFIQSLSLTAIATLHDVNMAALYCNWLVLLKEGELLACGPTRSVFTQKNISELFEIECRVEPHPYHNALWMIPEVSTWY